MAGDLPPWDVDPGVSVGPFVFGAPLNECLRAIRAEGGEMKLLLPAEDSNGSLVVECLQFGLVLCFGAESQQLRQVTISLRKLCAAGGALRVANDEDTSKLIDLALMEKLHFRDVQKWFANRGGQLDRGDDYCDYALQTLDRALEWRFAVPKERWAEVGSMSRDQLLSMDEMIPTHVVLSPKAAVRATAVELLPGVGLRVGGAELRLGVSPQLVIQQFGPYDAKIRGSHNRARVVTGPVEFYLVYRYLGLDFHFVVSGEQAFLDRILLHTNCPRGPAFGSHERCPLRWEISEGRVATASTSWRDVRAWLEELEITIPAPLLLQLGSPSQGIDAFAIEGLTIEVAGNDRVVRYGVFPVNEHQGSAAAH